MPKNRLKYLARHDPVTGAHNRHFVTDKLRRWIKRRKPLSVLVIDLDDLKLVNDSLGHAAGDAVIQEVVDRCRGQLTDDEIFGRVGGDEFVLASRRFADKAAAAVWAREIMSALVPPFFYQDRPLRVSAAAGLAQSPEDGATVDDLLAAADLAMYASKAGSRRVVNVVEPELRARAARDETLRRDFRRGLDDGELELFYQPKVRLTDQRVVGFEALVRWWHPRLGLLRPGEFLPAIHKHALSLDLATRVVELATAQARAWRGAGLASGPIAINVDNPAFLDPELNGPALAALLAEDAADLLQIELTEQVTLAQSSRQLGEVLARLRRHGFEVALDDFGTGFASLTHLQQLPFDVLKIDRSFIARIHAHPERAAIVQALITLAHQLAKEVVAEGIETTAESAWLGARGCDTGQGFLFARPLRAERATALLRGDGRLGEPGIAAVPPALAGGPADGRLAPPPIAPSGAAGEAGTSSAPRLCLSPI